MYDMSFSTYKTCLFGHTRDKNVFENKTEKKTEKKTNEKVIVSLSKNKLNLKYAKEQTG